MKTGTEGTRRENMGQKGVVSYGREEERERRVGFAKKVRGCPIPDEELVDNLGLFLNSKTLSRIKFMDFLYSRIVDVMGVVMEFGTRWGQNIGLFSSLRGIYEPFNRTRSIIAFDTFEGFPGVSVKDGLSPVMREGAYSVTRGYESFLSEVMDFHEQENPLDHIRKYELVKGDVCATLPVYLDGHPETVIALAYFDLDLYEPTRVCLELIQDRLVKGSVVGFDEINEPVTPGETLAVMEVLGLNNIRLKRLSYASRASYFVVE